MTIERAANGWIVTSRDRNGDLLKHVATNIAELLMLVSGWTQGAGS